MDQLEKDIEMLDITRHSEGEASAHQAPQDITQYLSAGGDNQKDESRMLQEYLDRGPGL